MIFETLTTVFFKSKTRYNRLYIFFTLFGSFLSIFLIRFNVHRFARRVARRECILIHI